MRLKNKAIIFSIALLSATTLIISDSFAATGTVTAETVRMREKPTTQSEILINLDQGDKVEVLSKEDGWYQVEFEGKNGYVSSNYLEVSGEISSSISDENTENNEKNTNLEDTNTTSEENYITTNVDDENNNVEEMNNLEIEVEQEYTINKNTSLYILPLVSTIKLGDINANTKVSVKEITNLWAYVSCDLGNGWIIKEVLNKNENSTDSETVTKSEDESETVENSKEQTESSTSTENNRVGYVNVGNVYVRGDPSTDSEPIGSLELNDKVTILGEENNWYKIEYEDREGYIAEKLISNEKVTNTTSSRGMSQPRGTEKISNEIDIEENTKDTTSSKNTTGYDIVEYAKTFLGAKYVSGGNGPSSFDCSGFTKYVYNHFGYTISRTSAAQANNGVQVGKDELQQGDLLIFLNDAKSSIGHVGIYIGGNRFIHAANATRGVVTDSVDSSYYGPRFVEARRIL